MRQENRGVHAERSLIILFLIKLFDSLLDLGIISFLDIFLQFMKFFHVTLYLIIELIVVFVHGCLPYYRVSNQIRPGGF